MQNLISPSATCSWINIQKFTVYVKFRLPTMVGLGVIHVLFPSDLGIIYGWVRFRGMARILITDKNVAPGSTKYVDPGMRLTGQNQEHAHWLSVLGLGLRMYLWVCF